MRHFVLALLLMTPATAHDWYPTECCNNRDCKPVDCDTLIERPDGSVIDADGRIYSNKDVKVSKDLECHTCVAYGKPLCVFLSRGS